MDDITVLCSQVKSNSIQHSLIVEKQFLSEENDENDILEENEYFYNEK